MIVASEYEFPNLSETVYEEKKKVAMMGYVTNEMSMEVLYYFLCASYTVVITILDHISVKEDFFPFYLAFSQKVYTVIYSLNLLV